MTEEQRLQKLANSISRRNGYGRADSYKFGIEDKVISHTRYGYRKTSNGQYVSNAYRKNFGWKNTYYQEAITVVQISITHIGQDFFLANYS
jgi:hypothetical protein